MNVNQDALKHFATQESPSVATTSALFSSDQEVIVLDKNPSEDPVLLDLKGCSLYNHKEKQKAIVDFLSL